jgi:nuclear-control-of-ATPase protein 2
VSDSVAADALVDGFAALPVRLLGLARTVMRAIRAEEVSLQLSLFTPSSLRRLFPFRPNALVTAMFPRLRHQAHFAFFAPLWRSPVVGSADTMSARFNHLMQFGVRWIQYRLFLFRVPLDLARHECQSKRIELEAIRDRKAEILGTLSKMRERLRRSLLNEPNFQSDGPDDPTGRLVEIIWQIDRLAAERPATPSSMPSGDTASSISFIRDLACNSLPSHVLLSSAQLRHKHLLRPSRLTLLWPHHLVLVSFGLYAIRHLYSSQAMAVKIAIGAYQTVKGFLMGYLLEPLRDVVNTVRSGGETGIIVRKEGIDADFDVGYLFTLLFSIDGRFTFSHSSA